MQLSFIYPAALALLVLVPLLWALALVVPRRLSPARFWSSLAVRSALILALVFALSGAQFVSTVHNLTTVFVLDVSDSISSSLRAQGEAFIHQSLQVMRPGDQAAVVVFGENALVERAPNSETAFAQINSVPVVARTNLQDALQLGMALFPADTQKRIVLLSDGGENTGHALDAAQLAAARHIPISVVDLSSVSDDEALLAELRGPSRARDGQEITLVTVIESTLAQPATVRLFADQTLIGEQKLDLNVGQNQVQFQVQASGQGFQHYRAEVVADHDNRVENNQAEALVRVDGPPRVLLVEGIPGQARQLQAALAAAKVETDLVAPSAMPVDLAGLSDYEAIVLVNVAVQDIPVSTVASIPIYVRDLGRGLMMIGGDQSFGVGGYSKTPIEEALPVYMDVRDHQERPDLALVFVIDKSGSMDACHCSGPNRQSAQITRGGTPKIEIAKDAVAQAAAVLRSTDTIGVVAFDGAAHWVVPAASGQTVDQVAAALSPVAPDGGTNVRAGLQAAERTLRSANARIKHAILLTDGWSGGGDNLDIAKSMRESGITLSVVAAGNGSAEYLSQLADAGGGRYYPAASMDEVPHIFVQETITAAGNYLVETPFTPVYAAPSSILDGLENGLPQLYGYNGTTPKETATVVLGGIDQAPVLAEWQFGLGRSLAWTSDVTGRWGKDLVQWKEFPRFATQLIDWVLPGQSDAQLDTSFEIEGQQTTLDVRVPATSGDLSDNLNLQARLIDPSGQANEITLTEVAPGDYRASFGSPQQGTYLVQISGDQGDHTAAQAISGLVIPYSPEYRQNQSNPALLQRLTSITGGSIVNDPAEAFVPVYSNVTRAYDIALPLLMLVLLLLPLDIALRRFMIRHEDLQAAFAAYRGSGKPAPAEPDPQYQRLRNAKQRAQHRTPNEPKP